jgi:hypothetical protein
MSRLFKGRVSRPLLDGSLWISNRRLPGCDPRRRSPGTRFENGRFAGVYGHPASTSSSGSPRRIRADMRRCDPSRELLARSSRNRRGRFEMAETSWARWSPRRPMVRLLGAREASTRALGESGNDGEPWLARQAQVVTVTEMSRFVVRLPESVTVNVMRTRALPCFFSARSAAAGRATRIGVVVSAPSWPCGVTVPQ